MLIRPTSDWHLEFLKTDSPKKIQRIIDKIILPPLPTDPQTILIIAGDLGLGHQMPIISAALEHLSTRFEYVLWVAGNHFYYFNNIFGALGSYLHGKNFPMNVQLLEDLYMLRGGIVFVGATLWTSFGGSNPLYMLRAKNGMNDFRIIKDYIHNLPILPEDTIPHFTHSASLIFEVIRSNKKVVVVTHHAPSFQSIPRRYQGDDLNYAYASDLDNVIHRTAPLLWVHGHTHDSFDYNIDNTRIICNPYGYKDYMENEQYQNKLVIEV